MLSSACWESYRWNDQEKNGISMIVLRNEQADILAYQSGKMGIIAVPGSGKTWTLSLLAADLVARGVLREDQEVLVVTLVNSAVDHFYQRVSGFLEEMKMLPQLGYRVRTLHGLAHDIVRERPGLVGLSDRFQIIDEREAESIRQEVAQAWMHSNPAVVESLINQEVEEGRFNQVMHRDMPELISEIGNSFIRMAKDRRISPESLLDRLDALEVPMPLAQMGVEIYRDYQAALSYRGAVDFDDLIRLALQALETDPQYLERLRARWPYILEDEAQDSSRLQEEILRMLVGIDGNWVRVGDPNQAIYETFTTANPGFLRDFVQRPDVVSKELPVSGRSTPSIIRLANYLVEWTQFEHPTLEVRDALRSPPIIQPASPSDPNPNPLDDPQSIKLILNKYTPQEEIKNIANSIERWLPDHPESTVAVLTTTNPRAFEFVDELRQRHIPYEDSLLKSSSSTRRAAHTLGEILKCLSDPQNARKLANAFKVWGESQENKSQSQAYATQAEELIRKLNRVEDYLWPQAGSDWLEQIRSQSTDWVVEALRNFRNTMRRWHASVTIPVDQIMLSISQELLSDAVDLALAHKLALVVRQSSQAHPSWHLPELADELGEIAGNQRRFLGFSENDTGFDPDKHKGKVVVATMHKSKGLEWDRVYLMSVNNYDFPSGMPYDQYLPERWFVRDRLNLEEEALSQVETLLSADRYSWYEEGAATQEARMDYVRERLRLLYVGITRAKRELIVTWNSGRRGDLLPAVPLVALSEFWRRESGGSQV
jgi:DNA helicase-2/ATP-dependent DNA helicase PcrA